MLERIPWGFQYLSISRRSAFCPGPGSHHLYGAYGTSVQETCEFDVMARRSEHKLESRTCACSMCVDVS